MHLANGAIEHLHALGIWPSQPDAVDTEASKGTKRVMPTWTCHVCRVRELWSGCGARRRHAQKKPWPL